MYVSCRAGAVVIALACAAGGGCSSSDDAPATSAAPVPAGRAAAALQGPRDAGVPGLGGSFVMAPPRDAITAIAPFDPRSGMHLDDDGNARPAPPPPVAPPTGRPAARQHPIDVTLRSSPPGATASVDGVPLGPTPTFWPGDANGREHEFTFVLAGYASARYRFVPITSGVIHARLESVADDPDAGVDPQLSPTWTPAANQPPGP